MAHQVLAEERRIEAVEGADGVDDGVLGRQLEHDGDVAELEVGVDEHDGLVGAAPGQDDGQVDGQHGLPGAALGGEHRDDLAQACAVLDRGGWGADRALGTGETRHVGARRAEDDDQWGRAGQRATARAP